MGKVPLVSAASISTQFFWNQLRKLSDGCL